VSQGRKLYETRRYDDAVTEWKKAVAYGYDQRAADQLVARAKEQVRREEAARRHAAELARQRQEEEKRKAAELARQEEEKRKAEEAAKQAAAAAAKAEPAAAAKTEAATAAASEENKRQSQQYYLSGIIYFNKGDLEKARNEWTHALQLDPGNSDAKAGLERINSKVEAP